MIFRVIEDGDTEHALDLHWDGRTITPAHPHSPTPALTIHDNVGAAAWYQRFPRDAMDSTASIVYLSSSGFTFFRVDSRMAKYEAEHRLPLSLPRGCARWGNVTLSRVIDAVRLWQEGAALTQLCLFLSYARN